MTAFSVGARDPWLSMSDHVPLVAAFDDGPFDETDA
jgi:hypothetical protein